MASRPEASKRGAGAEPSGWPHKIGILNDYVRIPYANGSSFASQFLYREFRARGHRVTVVGPEDRNARPEELPQRSVALRSVPLRNHPGVQLALPSRARLKQLCDEQLDILLGQSGSAMMEAGVWLRATQRVPFVSVNTIHLPSVYNVILPESLYRTPVNEFFRDRVVPWIEQQSVDAYNQGDGLIVLSEGLKRYWRERGVTVPIWTVPRAVDPAVFDEVFKSDPFPASAKRGGRLLAVCRLTREKGVADLIEIFARHIAPAVADASLTLVGDGPDRETFRAQAERQGVAERVHFIGERPLGEVPGFLRHGDLFVYASLSETYGQVVSEAQWCGLPVVALSDRMGVSEQIQHRRTGILVDPERESGHVAHEFGRAVLDLLRDSAARAALSERAAEAVRLRARPERCIARYYDAFAEAREHCLRSVPSPGSLPAKQALSLARWTGLHLTLAGAGLLRQPVPIQSRDCQQPVWDKPENAPPSARRPSASAALALELEQAVGS
ncbi:MAG: glycosyltransferase [Myxococcales bacterium]|jgi:glycosyltransferase involved in cell wall biosynthesis